MQLVLMPFFFPPLAADVQGRSVRSFAALNLVLVRDCGKVNSYCQMTRAAIRNNVKYFNVSSLNFPTLRQP